jgi:hypothetical protein
MNTWLDRLRVALIFSPALFLLHVWMLVCSNGFLFEKYGLVVPFVLAAISSVVEVRISAHRDRSFR